MTSRIKGRRKANDVIWQEGATQEAWFRNDLRGLVTMAELHYLIIQPSE